MTTLIVPRSSRKADVQVAVAGALAAATSAAPSRCTASPAASQAGAIAAASAAASAAALAPFVPEIARIEEMAGTPGQERAAYIALHALLPYRMKSAAACAAVLEATRTLADHLAPFAPPVALYFLPEYDAARADLAARMRTAALDGDRSHFEESESPNA